MKQSNFFKSYFDSVSSTNLSVPLVLQLSFFSNAEVAVFRQLVLDFNKKFNKSILGFYFFSQSSLSSFKNKGSSFNYIFLSSSPLASFSFFDSILRLNLGFSVIASNFNDNNILSVNFFKAFLGNKFLSHSIFLKVFAERLLTFLKKIEFYNNFRLLTFLKKIKSS